MQWFGIGVVLIALLLAGPALAAESPQWELGLRGGTDATSVHQSYNAGELYLFHPLPWQAGVPGGHLRTRLDCGAGWVEAAGDNGGWLAAGADLVYALTALPLELEAGFRPAWFPDSDFSRDDLGGPLLFSSHAGVTVNLSPVTISYRFQHLSNGGLVDDNPGLDLHLLGCGVRF
jgi:hypothetical protein